MKKNYDTLLWGCSVVAVGVLFLLNLIEVITFNIWQYIIPLFFVVLGASFILNNVKGIWGYIISALGLFLFARKAFNFELENKYILAILIIIVGIYIISNMFTTNEIVDIVGKNTQFTIFGSRQDKITNPDYVGTKTICIFGGHEIDLRNFDFTHDVEIVIATIFGGVTLYLPHNIDIVTKTLPIFGGIENKTQNTKNNPYKVSIIATAIFGGVEINN